MKPWGMGVLAAAVLLGGAGEAMAHEFQCEKTVNGTQVARLTQYPATLNYGFVLRNIHPTMASDALAVEDALLAPFGFAFTPAAPFSVAVGGTATSRFSLQVPDYQACLALAARDGRVDGYVDNVLRVRWDMGETQCWARVVCAPPRPPCEGEQCEPPPCEGEQCEPPPCEGEQCEPPPCEGEQCEPPPCEGPDCPPPPCEGDACEEETGATRTIGFYKNHEQPLQQCLDEGPIDLGFVTITTLEEALGLLYASPQEYESGDRRSRLDRVRVLLGRQTLAGICNLRLFGTEPSPPDLLDDAVAALGSQRCEDISDLIDDVDGYNNSGTEEPFPSGFDKGESTPQHAESIADDPTAPSGQGCDP